LRGKPCETYVSDMRLRISGTGLYTYPDVIVVCGPPLFTDGHRDTLVNPILIVEVFSASTEAYDRGEKFRHYRSIESFAEYVLVAQDKHSVDHFVKQDTIWTIREVDRHIELATVPCVLTFSEIYERTHGVAEVSAHEARERGP